MRERVSAAISRARDRRTTTRRRIEEVFSRDVLGSILVSLALSKVVESALILVAPGMVARLVGWVVLAVAFIWLFVAWERVASAAKETTEKAADAAESAAESVGKPGDGSGAEGADDE